MSTHLSAPRVRGSEGPNDTAELSSKRHRQEGKNELWVSPNLQLSLQLLDLLEGLLRGALHVLCLQCGKEAGLPDVPLGIPVPHDLPDLLQVVNVLQAEEWT